jgi:DNA-directed RNA polymerase specialized sigma subunit
MSKDKKDLSDKLRIKEELDITIEDEELDKQYINKLNKTEDKVKYLRFIKGYTQLKASEIIGISERHVRRIERCLKY